MTLFIVIAGLAVCYLNVLASIALKRSEALNRSQKLWQLAIIWLVPMFGALLVLHLLSESEKEAIPNKWIPQALHNYIYPNAQAEAIKRSAVDSQESIERVGTDQNAD